MLEKTQDFYRIVEGGWPKTRLNERLNVWMSGYPARSETHFTLSPSSLIQFAARRRRNEQDFSRAE